MAADNWTDEVIERLRALDGEGLSNALIASKLNEEFKTTFNRNAVIGKRHRLGMPAHSKTSQVAVVRKVRQARAPKPITPPRPKPSRIMGQIGARPSQFMAPPTQPIEAEPEAVFEILEPLKTLFDLAAGDCRMILTDRDLLGVAFCARPCEDGKSYCLTHCRRVFQAGYSRR